jgi:hypothetical protein
LAVTLIKSKKSAYRGPDPYIVKDQLASIQNLLKVWGSEAFMRYFFWILRKQEKPDPSNVTKVQHGWNKRLVPFSLNRIQQDINNRLTERNICLKARQVGYTTYFILRRLCLPAISVPGSGCLLISQNSSSVSKHFDIVKRTMRYVGCQDPYDPAANQVHDDLMKHLLHMAYSNRREIIFDALDSRIMTESAEVEEAGQGVTLHNVVASEVARWATSSEQRKGARVSKPEEVLANMKEAIVMGGTLDLESTANGMGGYFYEECMRAREAGKSEFNYFFHEWWWHDEYRSKVALLLDECDEREKYLYDKFHLDLFQLGFRRSKVLSLRHNFEEKYPEDDITCFLLSGSAFFDRDIIAARYREVLNEPPIAQLRNGEAKIYIKRKKNRRYLIGADPATGRQVNSQDTDYCAAVVIDIETGEEVASYRARTTPEDFAYDLDELGRTYNNALIAVERTGDGGTTILTLQTQCQYTNIYKHREWFKRNREKQVIEVDGFPTSPKTRPIALNKLAWFIREFPERLHDQTFLEEVLRFVRDAKGKPAGEIGSHDDTISARWVAYYCREVVLGYLDPLSSKKQKYGEFDEDADESESEAA